MPTMTPKQDAATRKVAALRAQGKPVPRALVAAAKARPAANVMLLARSIRTLNELLDAGGITEGGYDECIAVLRRDADYDRAAQVARGR